MSVELGILDEAALVGQTLVTFYRKITTDQSYVACLVSRHGLRVLPICIRRSQRLPKALSVVRERVEVGNRSQDILLRPGDWVDDEWPAADVDVVFGTNSKPVPFYNPVAIPRSWIFVRTSVASPEFEILQSRFVLTHALSGDSVILYLLAKDGELSDGSNVRMIVRVPERWHQVGDGFTGRQLPYFE